MAKKRPIEKLNISGFTKKSPDRKSSFVNTLSNNFRLLILLAVMGGGGTTIYHFATKEKRADRVIEPEKKKYQFEVDRFLVESNSVRPEDFRTAYEKAKNVTGGMYWKPEKLSVEYGNVGQAHFRESHLMQDPRSQASWISENLDEIISTPRALPHELVHFLLGPISKKWPPALEEMIAGTSEEKEEDFRYEDLNAPWIQMPHPQSMQSGSPLSTPRYAALRQVGQRYREKLPEIIRSAFQRTDLTFAKLASFLGQFGIHHHILSPGKTGEYFAFVPLRQEGRFGYMYVRYRRELGQPDEFGWIGPAKVSFRDANGTIYEGVPFTMEGAAFVDPPPNPRAPLIEAKIEHPDEYFLQPLQQ